MVTKRGVDWLLLALVALSVAGLVRVVSGQRLTWVGPEVPGFTLGLHLTRQFRILNAKSQLRIKTESFSLDGKIKDSRWFTQTEGGH